MNRTERDRMIFELQEHARKRPWSQSTGSTREIVRSHAYFKDDGVLLALSLNK